MPGKTVLWANLRQTKESAEGVLGISWFFLFGTRTLRN